MKILRREGPFVRESSRKREYLILQRIAAKSWKSCQREYISSLSLIAAVGKRCKSICPGQRNCRKNADWSDMIKSATNYDVCSIAEKLLYCTTPSFAALTEFLPKRSHLSCIADKTLRRFYQFAQSFPKSFYIYFCQQRSVVFFIRSELHFTSKPPLPSTLSGPNRNA